MLLAFTVNAKSLVLVLADETQVYYLLDVNKFPVMTFGENTVKVNADQYTFSDISRFYISETDDPAGIGELKTIDKTIDGETLFVRTTGQVAVYKADGKHVQVKTSMSNGITAVSLASLKQGVYIVSIGNSSFKIQRR